MHNLLLHLTYDLLYWLTSSTCSRKWLCRQNRLRVYISCVASSTWNPLSASSVVHVVINSMTDIDDGIS